MNILFSALLAIYGTIYCIHRHNTYLSAYNSYQIMKTTTVIVVSTLAYSVLLSVVSITSLISLAPAAHAQTEGGCPGTTNPQGHSCQNPHNGAFGPGSGNPPVPSCNGPHSPTCRLNPNHLQHEGRDGTVPWWLNGRRWVKTIRRITRLSLWPYMF